MKISVIVCTYNRAESLSQTLQSLAVQKLPEAAVLEILVVDNNSKDRTREVVLDFCRRFPGKFRYLFEDQQGKSFALNHGIREAAGEVVAFTDDDVEADPEWLLRLATALLSGNWVGAGGRTLPEKTFVPPRWLPRDMNYALAPLAIYDLGSEARELTDTPFGNNMAFRRSAFEKHGGFRTDLGPCAGASSPQKSEDSEFGTRVLEAGGRLIYEPGAIVYHLIPKDRIQREYFQQWWFDKARADVQAFGVSPPCKYSFAGVPLSVFRRMLVSGARWMWTFDPGRRFAHKLQVYGRLGEVFECRHGKETVKTKRECDVQA
jgi:glycosyltransferase involved in cell wall biosynthesis